MWPGKKVKGSDYFMYCMYKLYISGLTRNCTAISVKLTKQGVSFSPGIKSPKNNNKLEIFKACVCLCVCVCVCVFVCMWVYFSISLLSF